MRITNGSPVPLKLRAAAERFVQWRRMRARGARIPPHLWALAVKLAALHGVSRTASTLRVGYYDLKRRLDGQRPQVTSQRAVERRPTFVEIPATTLAPAECVIELEHPRGGKMRVHLKGSATPDLAVLADSFWQAEDHR